MTIVVKQYIGQFCMKKNQTFETKRINETNEKKQYHDDMVNLTIEYVVKFFKDNNPAYFEIVYLLLCVI